MKITINISELKINAKSIFSSGHINSKDLAEKIKDLIMPSLQEVLENGDQTLQLLSQVRDVLININEDVDDQKLEIDELKEMLNNLPNNVPQEVLDKLQSIKDLASSIKGQADIIDQKTPAPPTDPTATV